MIKWIIIIMVGVGAYFHFASKSNDEISSEAVAQQGEAQSAQKSQSREPTEEQCRSVGGRIISGMGCVVGVPENSNSNPNFSPSEVEAMCVNDGSRYEPALNACVSSQGS